MNAADRSIEVIFLLILIFIIGAIIVMFFYYAPMQFILAKELDNFCQQEGFEDNGSGYKCITETKISDKKVICDWGVYKVDNCRWEIERRVVEVGK